MEKKLSVSDYTRGMALPFLSFGPLIFFLGSKFGKPLLGIEILAHIIQLIGVFMIGSGLAALGSLLFGIEKKLSDLQDQIGSMKKQ